MALLTVEIPEKLLTKLRRTGHPEEEVIVEALEKMFNLSAHPKHESESGENDIPTNKPEESIHPRKRKNQQLEKNLPREEVIRRLVAAGLIEEPGSLDSAAARAWRDRPEEEKQLHLKEMNELYFPDALASRIIIRARKRYEKNVPRQEVVRRLVATGLVRKPGSWDTQAAKEWRQLSKTEQEKLISEVTALYFPDSPASRFLIEETTA